jgi:hypothetical protein
MHKLQPEFKRKKKQKRKGVEIWKTLKGVSHIPTPQATTIALFN